MPYLKWHRQTVKKVGVISENKLYLHVIVFSLLIFTIIFFYQTNQGARNILNKSVADTSIILIGLSMLLTSLCYFWDFVDTKIIYRKHLGLVGFGYGVLHVGLSFSAIQTLLKPETWQQGSYWPLLTGALALGIFTIMALISNRYAANVLGGVSWRAILRTGYVAVALIWLHVFFLKAARIMVWYQEGMKTVAPTSLLLLIFMAIVIVLRILLWVSLKKKEMAKR